eukprot:CAMPEP_0173432798 /NCGR_PEP_ID=MMETSP1357-20121228/10473_1 /TAXON_ID=77926 /ORGANISM="Hemiselmis rufescens, Strain PCC563" /LENGTH=275 /DNA_ID=CAMNT_0014397445 /DNA_START=38 /DNA_END=865 /DNA_ORIENTATION=+
MCETESLHEKPGGLERKRTRGDTDVLPECTHLPSPSKSDGENDLLVQNCAIYIQQRAGGSHPPPSRSTCHPYDVGAPSLSQSQSRPRPPTPAAHVGRQIDALTTDEEDCGTHEISRLHIRPIETSHTTGHRRGAPRQRKSLGSECSLWVGRVWGSPQCEKATNTSTQEEGASTDIDVRWGSPDTTSSDASKGESVSSLLEMHSGWGLGGLGDGYNPNDGSDFAFLSLPMDVPILPGPTWNSQHPLPKHWFAPKASPAAFERKAELIRSASEDEGC